MKARIPILALGALVVVGASSVSAQYATPGPVVVEERSGYYYAPPIRVERTYVTEDALINDDVKAALAADPRLDSRRIAVETHRNEVSLSGLVTLPGEAAIADRDAASVPGVREVHNYLRSKVGDPAYY